MWLLDFLKYTHIITLEKSNNLEGALLVSITSIYITIRWHKSDLWSITIGIMRDWYYIVLAQPFVDIRKLFGAFIEKTCLLYTICVYITYLHSDVVLKKKNHSIWTVFTWFTWLKCVRPRRSHKIKWGLWAAFLVGLDSFWLQVKHQFLISHSPLRSGVIMSNFVWLSSTIMDSTHSLWSLLFSSFGYV